jgi:predicted XRE-type DNA-binding protein
MARKDQDDKNTGVNDNTIVETSSGNVFADLGLPDADELLVKSELVRRIDQIIRENKMTQTEAARHLGIEQPDVSNLLRGRLRGYSTERLLRFLLLLGEDVQITITPARQRNPKLVHGTISIVAP